MFSGFILKEAFYWRRWPGPAPPNMTRGQQVLTAMT